VAPEAQLSAKEHGSLDILLHAMATLPVNVVITHDKHRLIAYARQRKTLDLARASIEDVLRGEGLRASFNVSVWDESLGRWRQIERAPSKTTRLIDDLGRRLADEAAKRIETRTLTASAGKLVRADLEQTMLGCAKSLGLECAISERNRLLATQVEFTVTGSQTKIDEFRRRLIDECGATGRRHKDSLGFPPGL
jgi:hypothetical protein